MPDARAESTACDEEARWISAVPMEGQESIMLKLSQTAAMKFIEIISQPEATSSDQLWAYKILSMSHFKLAHLPYASPHTRSVLSEVESLSSNLIRGELQFAAFKAQFASLGGTISGLMVKAERQGGSKFAQQHTAQIERLSACIISKAMINALPPKSTGKL
jgi:hypothetical protein